MSEKDIIELARDRAEQPDQVQINNVAAAAFSYAHLGDTRAIATVSLLNGGKVHSAAFAGLTETDRLALIGGLHRLIGAIEAHEDVNFFNRQPKQD